MRLRFFTINTPPNVRKGTENENSNKFNDNWIDTCSNWNVAICNPRTSYSNNKIQAKTSNGKTRHMRI